MCVVFRRDAVLKPCCSRALIFFSLSLFFEALGSGSQGNSSFDGQALEPGLHLGVRCACGVQAGCCFESMLLSCVHFFSLGGEALGLGTQGNSSLVMCTTKPAT